MKKIPHALTMAIIALTSPLAFATSSTDLTVTGLITPNACTPTLADGGNIDIGKIPAKDLHPTLNTAVGKHYMQFNVACDAPIEFALKTIDNKPGTNISSPLFFGVGLTPADEKLGYFWPYISNRLADGQPVDAIRSRDGGASWTRTSTINSNELLSVSTIGGTTPIAVKDLSMLLYVETYIARADSLTLNDEVPIDGSMTLEIKYLP
ncbi:DUF1120 domain-containing protein [Pseudomonas fluorescens]